MCGFSTKVLRPHGTAYTNSYNGGVLRYLNHIYGAGHTYGNITDAVKVVKNREIRRSSEHTGEVCVGC
jgi:hypothetical protein